MKKKHRIFIAINLPEDIKKYLYSFSQKYKDLPARWVTQDNLHITLVFLGYLTDLELGETCMVVKKVVESQGSFGLSLNKVIYGPIDKKPPRMVWAEGEKSKELSLLKKDLEQSLSESTGFKPEVRSFSPHITLARLNMMEFRAIDPEERPEINENVDINFGVESIEVMESKLRRVGPEYTILESHSLISK